MSTAAIETPDYYLLPPHLEECHDLTDLFVQRYGAKAVLLHLLMEQEQYLWRSLSKGQLCADQRKIGTLAARVRALIEAYPESVDTDQSSSPSSSRALPLDEMATILATNGWMVGKNLHDLRQALASRHLVVWQFRDDAPMLTSEELEVEVHRQGFQLSREDASTSASPWEDTEPETIAQAAHRLAEQRSGALISHDGALLFAAALRRHGFQPTWQYAPHAAQCERLLPEWFAPTDARGE